MAYRVSDIEALLFKRCPQKDAEPWDRVGLFVGNRNQEVDKIALALDITDQSIIQAKERGAELIVSHHPLCIDLPFPILAKEGGGTNPGMSLFEAVRQGVSIVSMHTNLDRSEIGTRKLPSMLQLNYLRQFEKRASVPEDATSGRLGALCQAPTKDYALKELAQTCKEVFGRSPRIWGAPEKLLENILVTTGAGSCLFSQAIAEGIDVIVCGEASYHACLDASLSDVAVVLLGHDVSELPLREALHDILVEGGVSKDDVLVIDEPHRWWTA